MGEVISLDEYRVRKFRKVWGDDPDRIESVKEFVADSDDSIPDGISPVDWYIIQFLSSDPDWEPRPMETIEELSQEIKRWRKAHKIGESS